MPPPQMGYPAPLVYRDGFEAVVAHNQFQTAQYGLGMFTPSMSTHSAKEV